MSESRPPIRLENPTHLVHSANSGLFVWTAPASSPPALQISQSTSPRLRHDHPSQPPVDTCPAQGQPSPPGYRCQLPTGSSQTSPPQMISRNDTQMGTCGAIRRASIVPRSLTTGPATDSNRAFAECTAGAGSVLHADPRRWLSNGHTQSNRPLPSFLGTYYNDNDSGITRSGPRFSRFARVECRFAHGLGHDCMTGQLSTNELLVAFRALGEELVITHYEKNGRANPTNGYGGQPSSQSPQAPKRGVGTGIAQHMCFMHV